jgi:predicted Ser/Thr protein kinase
VRGDEGREIAGFRIESEIGRGGMGVVYLAHQTYPERKVALKLLSTELGSDPAFRERFVHESNAAASTEHPNIVPVYGAGEADGQLYLAMRFIEGTDLGSLLKREGALSPERATRICAEIADALEAAHDRGLIHRDVKPGNILLDSRDRAYLTDFGLIRRTQLHTDITKTGQFMGTVDYCAPEQIKGGEIDGRADVYSLGCMLFECLTGAPPFRKDTEVATIYAHLEEDVPKASSKHPGISPLLSSVATKAMAKRPEDRFATAGEMAGALRGSLLPDDARKRRGRRLISIAALVVIAAVVGFLAFRDEDTPPAPSTQTPGPAPIPLNSLVQLDGETGDLLATVPLTVQSVDDAPAVGVGEGGVWVLTHPAGAALVLPFDVDAATLGEPIALGVSRSSGSIAVGFRTVWVGGSPGIVRIDPIDGDLLRSVRVNLLGVLDSPQVALGEGSAWAVTPQGELSRVDSTTGKRTGVVDLGQTASGLAVGFDTVWVIDELQGTLTRVDPKTLDAEDPMQLGGSLDAIEAGAGAVWILDKGSGIVTPIDPESGIVGSPIRVGVDPIDIAAGLDALWVANLEDGTISRIEAGTRQVETIQIGSPVASIAVDESTRDLWIVIARRP